MTKRILSMHLRGRRSIVYRLLFLSNPHSHFVNLTKSLRTRSSYRIGQVYVVGDRRRYLWFRLISYFHHETQAISSSFLLHFFSILSRGNTLALNERLVLPQPAERSRISRTAMRAAIRLPLAACAAPNPERAWSVVTTAQSSFCDTSMFFWT